MIQLACSILALAGSWLAFNTGGIVSGALNNAVNTVGPSGARSGTCST